MRSCALLLVLLAPLLRAASAQEPAPPQKPAPAPREGEKPDAPVIHVPAPTGADDVHEQMKKLIGEVELGLRKIDKLLAQAANVPRGGGAGLPDLVRQSQAEGQSVVQAIDKLLELSQHQHSGSQSGNDSGNGLCQSSGSKPGGDPRNAQSSPQPGESPLEGQRDTTTQRESTPDRPGSEQGPRPQGQQPAGANDPRGKQKSQQEGRNQPGQAPPKLGTDVVEHGPDAREAWGWLPEHARDVFRTQGGGAMPARYREWIDAYYRKLNQKP